MSHIIIYPNVHHYRHKPPEVWWNVAIFNGDGMECFSYGSYKYQATAIKKGKEFAIEEGCKLYIKESRREEKTKRIKL